MFRELVSRHHLYSWLDWQPAGSWIIGMSFLTDHNTANLIFLAFTSGREGTLDCLLH